MALKNLSSDEMLGVSKIWLERNAARMKAVPELTPLVAKARALHDALATAAQAAGGNPTLAELVEQGLIADAQHDNAIRALWHGYNAHAALVRARGGPDAERNAAAVERERDALLPNGLSATQVSYLAEAGAAQRIEEKLSADLRAKLAKRRIADGSFDELLTLWISAGNRLSEIERKRAALNQDAPAGVLAARNAWINFMNTATELLAMSDADPDAVRALRDPLADASARTEASGTAGTDTPPGPPSPAPNPVKPPAE